MNNMFWGVLLLLFGISLIIKAIFGFHIPIIKPVIGLFFIYLGITIILDIRHGRAGFSMGETHVKAIHPARQYSIVFGNGTIDLSNMKQPEKPVRVKINTVFGQSFITLNKAIPTQIQLNSVLAEALLPYDDLRQTSNTLYTMGDAEPLLYLDINVVFGKTEVNAVYMQN